MCVGIDVHKGIHATALLDECGGEPDTLIVAIAGALLASPADSLGQRGAGHSLIGVETP